MILKKIIIVSGPHGNEINPIWAVKKFRDQNSSIDRHIEYKYILGNPKAYKKGIRYVDTDLNRSFGLLNKSTNRNLYEVKRANSLVDQYGMNGLEPCQIAIDLHTTTANMGTSIVMYGRRIKDFCLAALLQNKYGLPIYLHENDLKQTGFLVEAWPCGLVIEIGSVAQNFFDPKIIKRFLIIIKSIREEINKLRNNEIQLPSQLVVHVHKGSIDYPRDENGEINALIHPERIKKDWKPIKKGDPLFLDLQGNTKSYLEEEVIRPVFIGEVAYKEKNIAMSYTIKEVIYSSKQWAEEFLSF